MDFKKLLEAMDKFAGERVGQKPGDQIRGTEKAAPNKGKHPFLKRLVGELKQPKSAYRYEQELAEAWLDFKETAPVPGQPAAAPGAAETTGRTLISCVLTRYSYSKRSIDLVFPTPSVKKDNGNFFSSRPAK